MGVLTRCGLMASQNIVNIDSGYGLSPVWQQTINWNNADLTISEAVTWGWLGRQRLRLQLECQTKNDYVSNITPGVRLPLPQVTCEGYNFYCHALK